VLELLRSPQLGHGMARELRKHVAILDREIVDLEQVCSARARRKGENGSKRTGHPSGLAHALILQPARSPYHRASPRVRRSPHPAPFSFGC
jgi:hypothetical protein